MRDFYVEKGWNTAEFVLLGVFGVWALCSDSFSNEFMRIQSNYNQSFSFKF